MINSSKRYKKFQTKYQKS